MTLTEGGEGFAGCAARGTPGGGAPRRAFIERCFPPDGPA
jgi:hypothetical protein